MDTFKIGQRWISEMEPELGLGIIIEITPKTVHILYHASQCQRQYAIQSAPIKRVQFKPGDSIQTQHGESFIVEQVSEKDGLLFYFGAGHTIPEQDLNDTLSFTTPEERLSSGLIDSNAAFELRLKTLQYQHNAKKSAVRGFQGGRIDLIPHQLYVAHEVSSRPVPRVLLSDEVGLGKTIEACLILHRLMLTNRIHRVLILVPESLVHQWFVELIRKFNFFFQIMDDAFCESVETIHPGANPFLETQLCLCNLDQLAYNNRQQEQVREAGWDMLIVDEAHHLTETGPAHQLTEQIARQTKGLMLLTATPELMGRHNHFTALRLLDPDRYQNYETFESDHTNYQTIAHIANKLIDNQDLNVRDKTFLKDLNLDITPPIDHKKRENLVEKLLDRHGIGRVMFRNTRAVMTGFPKRQAHIVALETDEKRCSQINKVFLNDNRFSNQKLEWDYTKDPRIVWLADMLSALKDEKVLLICRSKEKVCAIHEALKKYTQIHSGLFHEDLTLIQRDKNAAWFSQEEGAQILLCSEIGSEGRNFQFAHHLILFDLPLNPELLEQRIGRLDRIGQTKTIHIHVPFLKGSLQENLVRWNHEGLNAFEYNVPGIYELWTMMEKKVRQKIQQPDGIDDLFIKETIKQREQIAVYIQKGRNRLLELQSFRKEIADNLIYDIQQSEKNQELIRYTEDLFGHFGIQTDPVDKTTQKVDFFLLENPDFPIPPLREDNLMITFDRTTAIHREDIEFITWDHPMLINAMDLLLGSEKGNCAVAQWPGSDSHEILLEAVYVLECVAVLNLQVDRFLPPTPVRIMINQEFIDKSSILYTDQYSGSLVEYPSIKLLENPEIKALVPKMVSATRLEAEKQMSKVISASVETMEVSLQKEITRLKSLKEINPTIQNREIEILQQEKERLKEALNSARLRLDGLRFIVKT